MDLTKATGITLVDRISESSDLVYLINSFYINFLCLV